MANNDVEMILNVGHGVDTFPDTGSKGVMKNGVRYAEHTANVEVGKRVAKILDDHGVKYLLTQPFNGKDVPLSTRVNKANATNAKLYHSIHMNAGNKDAKGMCIFYHGYGSSATANGKKADSYVKYAKEEGLDLYHGGKWGSEKGKWNDFYETRMPKMFSVITENGFMTNSEDFERIFKNKNNYYDKVARVNAKFALDVLGIKYKGDTVTPAKTSNNKETKAETYTIVKNISGYKTADDAKNKKKQASTVTKGSYFVYKKSSGMINVSKKQNSPGSWINPSDNKADTTKYHVVQVDESVWELAQKYKTTVDKISALNKLKDPSKIYPGQKLRVK